MTDPAHAVREYTISGIVTDVIDGETFEINNDHIVRLAGVEAPNLSIGDARFKPWPLAQEAKQALSDLILNKKVDATYAASNTDRYGRILAQVYIADNSGRWVQGEMLRQGFVRVNTYVHTRKLGDLMLKFERLARESNNGIWAHYFYSIIPPDKAVNYIGKFKIIEGSVLSVRTSNKTTYINFSNDKKYGFSAYVNPKAAKLGLSQSFLSALKNRKIRVRGWLRQDNSGPYIQITHPEQIETNP